MEAPKPVAMITNDGNEEISLKMVDIKNFDITLNNITFIFEFGKSENKENIIFKLYENNEGLRDIYYLLHLNFNEFNKLNAIFSFYQNIDEIYNFLLNLINDKKYSISLKNNLIILIFKFPMPGGKIIDINLELKENKIKKEDLLEKLYLTVNELLKENKLIKEEQKLIKDELKNKNNELENIKNEMKNVKNENEEIKNKLKNIEVLLSKINIEENEKNDFFDLDKSSIIKNNKEKLKLKQWISSNGKIKKINLLYRATRDGDNLLSFNNKCANKGPTISLIQTKKGRRFGGFSNAEWKAVKANQLIKDNTAFLFSLDNMEKYNILKPKLAIRCYRSLYFLSYGNNGDYDGISLEDNFKENKGIENHSSRVYNVPSDFCLSGGKKFDVEEVEVFQILFI